MNKTSQSVSGRIGFVLCTGLLGALTGCTTYIEQPRPREVYVSPPAVQVEAPVVLAEVVIRSEDDFYEPLTPYGRWVVVGSHGRCWIPGRVEANWRPYSNGNWQRTEAGWYWASDEPWAWATYHYGRWDFSEQVGWYWVPQTQWAPAWVSWHEGGGYVGWAPLQPSVTISARGYAGYNQSRIAPRAYVFVEPKRFLEPVRPTTVVVNNTTIINHTVNITNVKIVNNTVINEGPRTVIIEQASGHKVQTVPVREFRRKQEAEAVTHQRTMSPGREKKDGNVQTPIRNEAQPREVKVPADAPRRANESGAAAQEQLQRNAKDADKAAQVESQRRVNEAGAKAREESQRNARALEKKAQLDSERRAKEAEATAQEQLKQNGRDSKRAAQLDSQRQAKEAAVKAQEEARSKADAQRTAQREAQQLQHAKDLENKAQADAQKASKELEKKNQMESQRRTSEAAAKVQDEARSKANLEKAAQRDTQQQQRAKDLEKKAQAEAETKAHGKPVTGNRRGQVISEPDATNTVTNAQEKTGKGKPSPPGTP